MMPKRLAAYHKALPIALALFLGMMLFGMLISINVLNRPAWLPLHMAEMFGVFGYSIIILFVWRYLRKKIDAKPINPIQEKRILAVFFVLLVAVQGYFVGQMSVPMNPQCMGPTESKMCVWDFNFLAQGAADSVQNGVGPNTIDYLHRHQNNIPTFYLLKTAFGLAASIGFDNFQAIGIAMSMLAISLSIILVYAITRKFMGVKKALFSLVIISFVLPITLLYVPFFYTDTLSLPFPLLIIYLYMRFRDEKLFWRKNVLLSLMAVSAFIGSMIKFSVMIALIAVVIDLLIRSNKSTIKSGLTAVFTILLILAPLLGGYTMLSNRFIHDKATSNSITTPWTHYVMMGLGGMGQYSVSDDMATSKHTTESDAIKYNLKQIKERLANYGLSYPYFLFIKATGTWAAGDYESIYRLNNTGIVTDDYKPSSLQTAITSPVKYPFTFSNFLDAVQMLLILAIAVGAVRSYGQRKELLLPLLRLALFGLAIFLLIWETNSRYLLNYVPIMIILALPTLWDMSMIVPNKLISGYLSARLKLLKY